MGYGKKIPPDQVSIFAKEVPFDAVRIRAHLLSLPNAAEDPLGSGTIMLSRSREGALRHVARRKEQPGHFGWSSVLIRVTPEWVTLAQVVFEDTLVGARDFVQWMLDHFDCIVRDEYGNDFTAEIAGDASKLYPDLSEAIAELNREVPTLLEKIIVKPESGSLDIEAILRRMRSLAEAVPDPLLPDLFLLVADDDYAREHVVDERRAHPDRFPYVAAIEARPRSVVIHQNTWAATRDLCLRIIRSIAALQPVRLYDELGREHLVRDDTIVLREGAAPAALEGEGSDPVNGEAGPELEAEFLQRMKVELAANRCRWRGITVYEPKQATSLFEYEDGTVVWYRPNGTFYLPGPTYSIGVKSDPKRAWAGPEDTAFKIDPQGRPVPKDVAATKSPYPPDRLQDLVFKQTVMGAGERRLKR